MKNIIKTIIVIMMLAFTVSFVSAGVTPSSNLNGFNQFSISNYLSISGTNGIFGNLSMSSAPTECPAGTYMTYFNGSNSVCSSVTTNRTFVTICKDDSCQYQVNDTVGNIVTVLNNSINDNGAATYYIRKGTYLIDDAGIDISQDGVTIMGDGKDSTIIKLVDNTTYASAFYNLIRTTGNNIVLKDFQIFGNQVNNTVPPELQCLRISGDQNIVDGIYTNNCRDGIIVDAGNNNQIINNYVKDSAEFGITIRNGANENIVSNNIVDTVTTIGTVGITFYGIKIDTVNRNIVSNNIIKDVERVGVYFSGTNNNNFLTGNKIYNTGGTAIYGGNSYNTTITNNVIEGVLNGSGIKWQGKDGFISNNKISGVVNTSLDNYGIELYGDCEDTFADGNDILGSDDIEAAMFRDNSCNSGFNRIASRTLQSQATSYDIKSGDLTLSQGYSSGARTLRLEGYKSTSGADIAFIEFYNRADTEGVVAQISSENDGGNSDGSLRFWTRNGAHVNPLVEQLNLASTGEVKVTDLAGTYSGGSAFVCVYDSGELFTSEVACP